MERGLRTQAPFGHDYEGISWSLIADVIFSDMAPFVEQVSAILAEME